MPGCPGGRGRPWEGAGACGFASTPSLGRRGSFLPPRARLMFKARSRQRLMRPDNRELRGAAALARAAAAPKPGAGRPRHRGGSGDRMGRGSTRSTPPSPWAGHVPTKPTEPTEPTQHFGGQRSGGSAFGVPYPRRAKGAPQCRGVTGPGTCSRRRGWGGTGGTGGTGWVGGHGAACCRPSPSPCSSSCLQPVAPLGLCRRQARLRSASEPPLCSAPSTCGALGASWGHRDHFPVLPPSHKLRHPQGSHHPSGWVTPGTPKGTQGWG